MITIRLYSLLRKGRGKEVSLPFQEGLTVRDVLDALEIMDAEVGVVLHKGTRLEYHRLLSRNDTISVFPLGIGG